MGVGSRAVLMNLIDDRWLWNEEQGKDMREL